MSANCESRRSFLRHTGGYFALTLGALGVPFDLAGLPIGVVEGRAVANERSYPVPAVDGVSVDRSAQVVLVRADAHVYAFALACPHQEAVVRWLEKDHRFECTKHHSQYQPTGVFVTGRATRNMDRFPIRRDGASVFVDVSRVFKSDEDAAGWAAAGVAV